VTTAIHPTNDGEQNVQIDWSLFNNFTVKIPPNVLARSNFSAHGTAKNGRAVNIE
jgi:hypothetical protein